VANLSLETVSHVETVLQRYIDELPDDPCCGASKDGSDYKHPRWDMVRELKDDPYMAPQRGYEAIPVLQQIRPDVLTALGYDSPEEGFDDLEMLWDTVMLGASEDPLAAAVRTAERYPMTFRTKRASTVYARLLNISYHLQDMRGGAYISLPVVRMGEILGVSPMHVSRLLAFMRAEGFLRPLEKAHHFRRMAAKFRFHCWLDGDVVAPGVAGRIKTLS
jgi:hypothetical protein